MPPTPPTSPSRTPSQSHSTPQPSAAPQSIQSTLPTLTFTPADDTARLSRTLSLSAAGVASTITLLDDGNTVPFIARYRKEATGGLDEVEIRAVADALETLRALDARRTTVLAAIAEQGRLTTELRDAIASAETRTALEDLYLPYKQKRRTRAQIARERGLADLANLILRQPITKKSPETLAAPFVRGETAGAQAALTGGRTIAAVTSAEDALAGARDIVAETIADDPAVRGETRRRALAFAVLDAVLKPGAADERGVYTTYYDFHGRVDHIRPHQVLAINRAEQEGVLRVKITVPERDWRSAIGAHYRPNPRSPLAGELTAATDDAAARLLLPAIERDIRRALGERAEAHAIDVFGRNLRSLLLQAPLAGHTVLGLDPAYRTGCKLAIVDPTGRLTATAKIYPHPPQSQRTEAMSTLRDLIRRHGVTIVAIGNGTASRESERLVADVLRDLDGVRYVVVSEAGASVYSASPLARAELPKLDVTERGAVSIARRLQDPLAELVKIDPQSIGVGLYQHDVDQKALDHALDGVVESVVNRVGVDVNTASPALLARVAGIGPKLSESIVAHRDTNGPFARRTGLMRVAGLGAKAFEQSAGFLRIRAGDTRVADPQDTPVADPLDATAIHPESYGAARALLDLAGLSPATAPDARREPLDALVAAEGLEALADRLGIGVPTLVDIVEQLVRPGRDPRDDAPPPLLRDDVLTMADLHVGMRLSGTVRNVVDFGAFVDIGVEQDGLMHKSAMPPGLTIGAGDVVTVEVMRVECDRGRIGLGWVADTE